MNLNL